MVNETYFFREREQLEWLVGHVLVPACRAGRRPRVWWAACASGEEPMTVAMLLSEHGCAGQVDIVATDISQRVLDRARAGVFSPRSLRHSARPELAARFLEEHEGRLRLTTALAAQVDWVGAALRDGGPGHAPPR